MIRRYETSDDILIMELIESEGKDWEEYYKGFGKSKYLDSLKNSITYVMIESDQIIGYIRAIDDHGFDVYICDLLVHKNYRNKHYGSKLISSIKSHFPNRNIYVMSDVDPYYIKQEFKKVGSIFKIH